MAAVMAAERAAGREPRDVSAQNLGYDIESRAADGSLRLIEVKGRVAGADSVSVTRNELLVALNTRARYLLAVVFVADGVAAEPVYIQDPGGRLLSGDPLFGVVSVTLGLTALLRQTAPSVP